MKSIILEIACVCACMLTTPDTTKAQNLLPPIDDAKPWFTKTWSGEGEFAVVKQGKQGGDCFMIESKSGGDLSWSCSVNVEPGQTYLLSALIKTQDVQAGDGRGAQLNIHESQRSGLTDAVTGTTDWTRVETVVFSGDRNKIQLNCLLGGWGQSTGRAWFDQLSLVKLDLDKLPLKATIHADQTGEPISPFIYSQFIEHLGRCIYGGIWAEMLEDRKFYYPVTQNYDPYVGDLGGKFPVVGASPWEILGNADGVTMVEKDSFVGDHTPQLAPGTGIRQNDLGLVNDKPYVGYVWLKAPTGKANATVTLVWGEGKNNRQTRTISNVGPQYTKYPFKFQAKADTDKAQLELQIQGAPCLVGTLSLMPADNVRGMRADTLALLKKLDAPMYRWPGGNFVSGYNWRDGIGDRDRRPPRVNPAWTGVEHNDYGIDEFIDFCREVNTEPMIAANTGFGDAYSAAPEVEYCNGTADTVGGSWRSNNGHAKPYNVKYWCVGNEMFGPWQLGFMQLKHYTLKHNRVATAMWNADSTIQLVGVGAIDVLNKRNDPGEKRKWSHGMLEKCADEMTYLSEHFYVGQKDSVPEHVAQPANRIRDIAKKHRQLQASLPNLDGRIVPIAMDEWNYWHRPYVYGELGCVYELRDALGIAAGLHEYFRQSDVMKMAHYAQTVNVIGCVKTTKTNAFLSTTALPLMLYRKEYGTIPTKVDGNFTLLGIDVSAAWTDDRKALTIGLVNPHADEKTLAMDLPGIKPSGKATVWSIAGDDPKAFNTVDQTNVATSRNDNVDIGDSVKLAPYSITLIRLPVNQK